MTTTTLTSDVAAYYEAVAAEVADLPAADRAELLEDVEQHLAELAAEPGGTLRERLGEPAAYAAELRAAAGLPPRAEPGAGVAGWLHAPVGAASRATERVRATRAWREVREFAPQLRPAWWVARGYLAIVGLALMAQGPLRDVLPVPKVFGSGVVGLVVVGAAVVASVAIGKRTWGTWPRRALVVANVVAVLVALNVVDEVGDRSTVFVYSGGPERSADLSNIYPYDAEGRPLDEVLLLDQDGRSIADLVCAECHPGRHGTVMEAPGTGRFPLRLMMLDPVTGEVVGEVPRPTPYGLLKGEPTPTPSATPSATPTPSPTTKPSPKPTPTR